MMYWNYIVAALCLLLLAFLLWKEIRRANKAWLFLRVTASILAVAALAAMAMPLKFNRQKTFDGTNEAVILTSGFNEDIVNAFIKTEIEAVPVYYLDGGVETKAFPKARFIANTNDAISNEINVIHVFGEGLEADELTALQGVPLIFHPAELESGLTSISWTAKLKAGERLYVQGKFHNASPAPLKIILHGFGTNLDSVNVPADRSQSFELSTIPKPSGLAQYSIIALSGRDTIANEPVPVEVQPAVPLKLLVLAASPDFENRFLKDWLSQNAYAFAVRTTISKNKYSKEFLNLSAFPIDRINSSVMDQFDAVIADATAFALLSKQEQGVIKNYVDQKGVGLIIKTDSSLGGSSFYSHSFSVVQSANPSAQLVKLHLTDTASHLPELSIEQPLYLRSQPATQPIISDQQFRPFASKTIYGSGSVVVTTLSNTYQWVLAGKKEAYAQLWSAILNKATKKLPESEAWQVTTALPRMNEPAQLLLETQATNVPRGQVGEDFIYMQQSSRLPYQWRGTYSPARAGWQAGIKGNGRAYWWYAYSNADYVNVRAVERRNATQQYALGHPFREKQAVAKSSIIEVEFPKIWLFVVVLACCGFLWMERKFL